ncbi:MAG TPA: hypothetical protein VNY83_07485 [Solirubrobacterales bacterium]|jgi:hypothetical protein|nr:hypothetical protein [Solirubrobacterales bacterium]
MQETPADEITEVEPAGAPAAPPQLAAPAPPAAPEPPAPVGGAQAPPPPPPVPEGPLPPATPPAPVAPAEPKVMDAEWPYAGYSGPQPWEPGVENPPALTQNHLMLSSGSAGEEVVELAALLAHLSYGTSISAGQNPHAIYDSGVSDAVRAFCADYGVTEDPQVRAARTEDTVGPWLWEALVRAVHKKVAAQA